MIGQTDSNYSNYEHKISFWQMVSNPVLAEQEKTTGNKKKPSNAFMEVN